SSPRSVHRLGKLLTTSPGLGRMIGEMKRSSEPSPLVASHHARISRPTAAAPTRWRVTRGGASRRGKRGRFAGSGGSYFGAEAASAGYTFTSTRRFLALFSGSAGSAGRSHPTPVVEN